MGGEQDSPSRGTVQGVQPGASSELPMALTASTGPVFSPRNSFHKEFREPKLPVFVLGLFSEVLHKIMCVETQFSFQCVIVELGFRSRGC